MRFLHTADWHLGRLFHARSLLDDQAHVLDQFVALVRDVRPDAVLIAGDVYDRAVPPPEAVALLDDVLARIVVEAGVPVGDQWVPKRNETGDTTRKNTSVSNSTEKTMPTMVATRRMGSWLRLRQAIVAVMPQPPATRPRAARTVPDRSAPMVHELMVPVLMVSEPGRSGTGRSGSGRCPRRP